ncbi:MAG: cytosolic protein [Coleofasciculaceae cyanobacterium SM2_1_6]|nr:cytosolic protein [Coleofasciculaceae cyanobacterium SM2_1_6]
MSNPQTEFDSPWKDILELYFSEFIHFFLPVAHSEIDWDRPPEFLDKELQQVVRDTELGRRMADKLVKVWRKNGTEIWVLIHVEIQSQDEADFAERMFVYHYRIFDKYRCPVVSLAVLGDERRNWKPEQFSYQLWETSVSFNFKVVKLLEYVDRWAELETSQSPFAIVVVAHLKAQETRSDRLERKTWKIALVRRLYEQNYSRTEVINLFHFIDWVMSLPEELEQEFWQSVQQLEEDRSMPYITSVQRIGRQEGLLKGIELGLKLKFGAEGLAVLPEVAEIKDAGLLEVILSGLETANTLAEWRSLYQSPDRG